MIQQARSDVSFFIMNFVTILFAFLTMAYLVGDKLRSFQIWSVALLYSLFSLYWIATIFVTYGVVETLLIDFRSQHPESAKLHYAARGSANVDTFVAVLLILSWMLSLVFLLNTRRQRGT